MSAAAVADRQRRQAMFADFEAGTIATFVRHGANAGAAARVARKLVDFLRKLLDRARSAVQPKPPERAEILRDTQDQAAAKLRACGIKPADADATAARLADFLADRWGGQVVCFPIKRGEP